VCVPHCRVCAARRAIEDALEPAESAAPASELDAAREDREDEARLTAAVDAIAQRVATAHERVACPTCRAPVRERCRALPLGHGVSGTVRVGRTLKHSHDARLLADGITLR
jgi:hypothetical protein